MTCPHPADTFAIAIPMIAVALSFILGCGSASFDVSEGPSLSLSTSDSAGQWDGASETSSDAFPQSDGPSDAPNPDTPSAPDAPPSSPPCSLLAKAVQPLSPTLAGCAGKVPWTARNTLCNVVGGWTACKASKWVDRPRKPSTGEQAAPAASYWTDDLLRFSGVSGSCSVSPSAGLECTDPKTPMRVCAGELDTFGNSCGWTKCGWQSVTPPEWFGGCAGDGTAGAVCCHE